MNETYRTKLHQEIDQLISSQKAHFLPYFNNTEDIYKLLNDIEKLIQYTREPVRNAELAMVKRVRQHMCNLEKFLRPMDQTSDDCDFHNTELGQLWISTRQWYYKVSQRFPELIHEVWDLLAPVQPDTLTSLDTGLYEASWWAPVPMMDLEMLMRTPEIEVDQQPYELPEAPGSLAVQFSIDNSSIT